MVTCAVEDVDVEVGDPDGLNFGGPRDAEGEGELLRYFMEQKYSEGWAIVGVTREDYGKYRFFLIKH